MKGKKSPFYLFSVMLPGPSRPGSHHEDGGSVTKQRGRGWVPSVVWSVYTSAGVFISGFLLCERIYHPGRVPITMGQIRVLIHMAGLQSRPAMVLQAWFPSSHWWPTRAPLLSPPPAPATRVPQNPGAGETMPCPN